MLYQILINVLFCQSYYGHVAQGFSMVLWWGYFGFGQKKAEIRTLSSLGLEKIL